MTFAFRGTRSLPAGLVALAVLASCSSDDSRPSAGPSPSSDGGATASGTPAVDPGSLQPFYPPTMDPGPNAVLFTISGEALATQGFAFPPRPDQEVKFVDGWSVSFDRLITTVDAIALAETPDSDPNDPSKTGKTVAQADGPWAVDLANDEASYPAARGGEGNAIPLVALTRQNLGGDAPFDTAGARYAASFRTVVASKSARNVNLGPEALADYEKMINRGCSVLYVGQAEWKGDATCSPAPGQDPALDALPKKVRFNLCFKAPSSYLNCQNPDNDPAAGIGGESHARGVSFKANTFVTAQLTVHTDHPFWNSVEEDSPAVFDPMAAAAIAEGDSAVVTEEELAKLAFQDVRNRAGVAIPWRNCVGADYTPPAGKVALFSGSVQDVGPNGDPAVGLRHAGDFATYLLSTQGHLNADGLCFVKRNYPSPN